LRGLSARAVNALGRHGITDRQQAPGNEIMRVRAKERNCGRKTLADIEAWLRGDRPVEMLTYTQTSSLGGNGD
jgi:hypothetical protein